MEFNDKQIQAINKLDGRVRIVAGAGSGKTRVLTERYVKLLEKVYPSQILCVTFTNKAANEMKQRIESKVGELKNSYIYSNDYNHTGKCKILKECIDKYKDENRISINAGIPESTPSYGVNMVCGSGMQAIFNACNEIKLGKNLVLAGGFEFMSNVPYATDTYIRYGKKFGDFKMVDLMTKDGLIDSFSGVHMGVTAENIAKRLNITRKEQDKYSYDSQNKTLKAIEDGKFINEQKDLNLLFRGSKNQRLIDMPKTLKEKTILTVWNKADLMKDKPAGLCVSAKTGCGIPELWSEIRAILERDFGKANEGTITRERYRVALGECLRHLEHALQVSELELKAEDLRLAARALARITGSVDAEDLLDVIFKDFCIGK